MRQATLDEVGALAKQASAEIWRQARAAGRDPKIYLHWSAGRYTTPFADYHINILGDGTIMIPTDDFSDVLAHTWCRNSGAVGISLACAYGANTNNLGDYPPTSDQIEHMACAIVKVADALDLTIDKAHVMTHGEAADNEDGIYAHDPYGPLNGCERWDLEYLGTPDSPRYNPRATDGTRGGDVLRGKANWYRNQASQNQAGTSQKPAETSQDGCEDIIWFFLKGKGLNDFAAAGVMGNLYAESGLHPGNLENSYERSLGMNDVSYTTAVDNGTYDNFVHDSAGYGLAQWTYYSRKAALLSYAKARGTSIGDIGTQLDYLWSEMEGYGGMMKKLANAASVAEATSAFMLDFERPADQSTAAQSRRAGYAQGFYDKFAGTSPAQEQGEDEMRYKTLDEMPEWAKPTIEKLIAKGLLNGNGGDLDLSADMLRMFVINDRAGLYG